MAKWQLGLDSLSRLATVLTLTAMRHQERDREQRNVEGNAMSELKRVRLRIDADKCQGHNRCKAIISELIQLDAYGNAQAKGDGLVSVELIEKAYLAKSNCPEFAVEIIEE